MFGNGFNMTLNDIIATQKRLLLQFSCCSLHDIYCRYCFSWMALSEGRNPKRNVWRNLTWSWALWLVKQKEIGSRKQFWKFSKRKNIEMSHSIEVYSTTLVGKTRLYTECDYRLNVLTKLPASKSFTLSFSNFHFLLWPALKLFAIWHCAVPEISILLPTEGIWISWGRGVSKTKKFEDYSVTT